MIPLVAETGMEYSFYEGFVRHSFRGERGARGLCKVHQSMCSSVLTLPPLLLQ